MAEILTSQGGLTVAVDSRIGGREENQDSYGMAETPMGLLVVVCDGMGGGPAGKTASSMAVESVMLKCRPRIPPPTRRRCSAMQSPRPTTTL